MIKSTFKYTPLLFSLSLFGCGSSSDSDPDPRDSLTDIGLAKSFTQDFVTVKDAIEDMQAPLTSSVDQFAIDTQDVDQNAVDATQNVLSKTIAIAIATLQDAIVDGEVDYSQLQGSYTIASILSNCSGPCFDDIDLQTSASISYANNTLSLSNAQINSNLYEVIEYWDYNNYEYVQERGELIGSFSSAISFDISLPDPNLEGSNELAIGISNILSQSNDTQFTLELNNLGLSGELEATSNLTLNDLINLDNPEEITGEAITFEISEAQLELGAVQFIGSASITMVDDSSGVSNRFAISGEMTNSVGDVIGASIEINETNIIDEYEYTSEKLESGGFESQSESQYSADFDYNLEFVFNSQEHGDLSVKLTQIGSYISEYNSSYGYSYSEQGSYLGRQSEYNFSLSEMSEGNIQVSVAGKVLNLDYISELNESDENQYDSTIDPTESTESINSTNMIKITDASYDSRQVYILFNSEDIYTYEYDETLPNGSETDTSTESTGVYVDDVQYGELEFDLLENTSVMTFTDGEEIILQ